MIERGDDLAGRGWFTEGLQVEPDSLERPLNRGTMRASGVRSQHHIDQLLLLGSGAISLLGYRKAKWSAAEEFRDHYFDSLYGFSPPLMCHWSPAANPTELASRSAQRHA